MPYFMSRSDAVYFRETGQGKKAILLVHGWYQSGSQAWATLLPFLEKKYRVFIPDLPGHGLSPLADTKKFSVERVDDLLIGLIQHIRKAYKCTHVFIAGHSYGAFAVQRLLAREPGIVPGAVALAAIDDYAPYTRRLRSVLAIPRWFISAYYRTLALFALFPYGDRMLLYGKTDPALLPGRFAYGKIKNKTLSPRASHAYMRAFLHARVPWPEQKIRTPLLLIYGERDALTSPRWSKQITPHAQRATTLVVQNAGHNVQISGAAEVAAAMVQFFEKCFRLH